MKNKFKMSIVANNEECSLALPVYRGDKVVDVFFNPIVAWKVDYNTNEYAEDGVNTATPIGIETFNEPYAVFFYNSADLWIVPEQEQGVGKESLIEYFQSCLDFELKEQREQEEKKAREKAIREKVLKIHPTTEMETIVTEAEPFNFADHIKT